MHDFVMKQKEICLHEEAIGIAAGKKNSLGCSGKEAIVGLCIVLPVY
jgi:hypothetical protein